jgi:predicted glycosyltransferase
VLWEFNLSADSPYILLRLVAWGAAHDVRNHGFRDVARVVESLERFGQVVISSEGPLGPLETKRITGPLHRIHHVLAFARLYIGESATMASESATLGTPAVFVSTSRRGYTDDQEKRWGLTFNFNDRETAEERGLRKAVEILQDDHEKDLWCHRRQIMLEATVDVTDFIVRQVESTGRGNHD